MEYSTPLEKLPDQIVFPADLQPRIRFDPSRRQLSFDGFMCKRAYDELIAQHEDSAYRRAVERLFVLSADEMQPRRSRSRWSLWAALAAVAATLVLAAYASRSIWWSGTTPAPEQETIVLMTEGSSDATP